MFSVRKNLKKTDEEECFFEKKKHFRLFKSLTYKIEMAKNLPLVPGRLVTKKAHAGYYRILGKNLFIPEAFCFYLDHSTGLIRISTTHLHEK